MSSALWIVRPPSTAAHRLAAELGIPLPIARVLTNRGVVEPEAARLFLYGTPDQFHDPYLMKGMKEAVERIERAVERKERVLIFGDYDVDGVLSVVMLHKALTSLGAEVDYFIPERLADGYGIKEHHAGIVAEKNCSLVISVDCGIKAVEFTEKVRRSGIDVIITDHHMPGDALPQATAIIDPVLEDSGYPYRQLAGVGVVFKLIQALLEKRGRQDSVSHYLKLVCIGTVADVVELKGENRLFVKHGLKGLESVSNVGLKSLIEACGINGRAVSEADLGFRLGPRINAAGRMGLTELAVQLFFSKSAEESQALVKRLDELNYRRQRTEEKIFEQAREKVQARSLDERYRCLVLGSEQWHRGVIGIVASKLKDLFHRPVILFAYEGDRAHGSGRSISDVPLIDLLDSCRDLFLSYGGHRYAVGCTLPLERMDDFKSAINAAADRAIPDESLVRKLQIDAPLPFGGIDGAFLDNYGLLFPFGVGNPKPVFLAEGVEVAGEPLLMNGKHLKFLARNEGRVFEVLGWDKAALKQKIGRGSVLDLAYSVHMSEYLGESRVSLVIEDLKP